MSLLLGIIVFAILNTVLTAIRDTQLLVEYFASGPF